MGQALLPQSSDVANAATGLAGDVLDGPKGFEFGTDLGLD